MLFAWLFLVAATFGNSNITDSNGCNGMSKLYGIPSHSPFLALYFTSFVSPDSVVFGRPVTTGADSYKGL